MALLTPKDIREHTFQTVRFKEGYDVDEVDDFLDQVTETVEALGKQAVAVGQATQSLGPDVAGLNSKISELNAQVQSLQQENATLKSASEQAAGAGDQAAQAAQVAAAKLTEAEESNRALSAQNEQLKDQVDRLAAQVDQLTAQAAEAAGQADLGEQLNAVQHERDEFRARTEDLSRQLASAQQQVVVAQQQAEQIKNLSQQLEESKQREAQLRDQVSKVEPSTETGSLQKIAGAAAAASTEPERATAMLTLAMQLHDQYVDKGKAKAKDFPVHFADRCIHLSELLQAINGELSAFLLRKQYRRQLEETRRSAKGQYAQMSDLLTAAAAGLSGATPAFGEIPACVIGAALRPKEGEMVCGDTMEAFRTDSGLWCLLLADGMGSGDAARRESSLTCRLLRQFLEADIQPEAALTTLNSAMALRGAETGSFTTVDLCVLKGSEATFYKFGAAPSYLKKNGAVRRITGSSLPVGLRGTPAAPDITTVTLEPGSFAVMISDGVADPSRDEWLQDLLAGWGGDDPQTLANLILSESIRRERLQDDCAVQVLYRLPEPEQPV